MIGDDIDGSYVKLPNPTGPSLKVRWSKSESRSKVIKTFWAGAVALIKFSNRIL